MADPVPVPALSDFVTDLDLRTQVEGYLAGTLSAGGLAPFGSSFGPGSNDYSAVGDLWKYVSTGEKTWDSAAAIHDIAYRSGEEATRQVFDEWFLGANVPGDWRNLAQAASSRFVGIRRLFGGILHPFDSRARYDDSVVPVPEETLTGDLLDRENAASVLRFVGRHRNAYFTINPVHAGTTLLAVEVAGVSAYLVAPPTPLGDAPPPGEPALGPVADADIETRLEYARPPAATQRVRRATDQENAQPYKSLYPWSFRHDPSGSRDVVKWDRVIRLFDRRIARHPPAWTNVFDEFDFGDLAYASALSRYATERRRQILLSMDPARRSMFETILLQRRATPELVKDYTRYRRLRLSEARQDPRFLPYYRVSDLPTRRTRYSRYDSARDEGWLVDMWQRRREARRRRYVQPLRTRTHRPKGWYSKFRGVSRNKWYRPKYSGRTPLYRPRSRRFYNAAGRRYSVKAFRYPRYT